jgi:hypothetical protein
MTPDEMTRQLRRRRAGGWSRPQAWMERCAERIDAESVWHGFKGRLPVDVIAAIIAEYAETYRDTETPR